MKKNAKYIAALSVSFLALLLYELAKPPEIDWRLSFSKNDKIPYGAYILREMLPDIFPGQDIFETSGSIYVTLPTADPNAPELGKENYLFFNAAFSASPLDARQLLQFAAEGNQVFIAAEFIGSEFSDTLGFSIERRQFSFDDSITVNFANPQLQAENDYRFFRIGAYSWFDDVDTLKTTILGEDSDGFANFIKIRFGDGAFFISTVPLAFTNYNMLSANNAEYAAKALSYLPVQPIIWDEYYKAGRQIVRTPFRYVLSQDALQWGFYLLLATVVLFIFFQGRRKQRVIPVIPPTANTTLEFVDTVGRLYFQKGNHRDILNKKIAYLLAELREKYFIKTNEISEAFTKIVADRSGVEHNQVKKVFNLIKLTRRQAKIDDATLTMLNDEIEAFQKQFRR